MCDALYELLSGSPAAERPAHFYTDQRFALVLLAALLILPMSVHRDIAVHKYSRSAVEVTTAGPVGGGHLVLLLVLSVLLAVTGMKDCERCFSLPEATF